MELDGPYYSMLNFFDRVGKLERIVNVSGLLVATTKNPSGREGEAYLSVRAERERGGYFHGDDVLQSRPGAGGGGTWSQAATATAGLR